MKPPRVLVVDDERNIRRSMEIILEGSGNTVHTAEGAETALDLLRTTPVDAVFLDIMMPGRDGLDVLAEIRQTWPGLPVIMISGHGTVQNAMQATRLGAYDFIEKPLSKEKVLISLDRAFEHSRLQRENRELRRKISGFGDMIGQSAAMENIREQIARVAPTRSRVLILGESGSGKELVARAIHEASDRRGGPYIKVNCAAIPEELIEAELFGAEKGAYTGSIQQTEGKFQQADGGTLFLDEVGDMSLKVQAKVLRVLQEGEIERVGGTKTICVDVRVIAATNKDLEQAVAGGSFREDLYFRLNVVPILLPPLRQRRDDIALLAERFISEYCAENGFRTKVVQPEVMRALKNYDWPGNVRELKNIIERLVILSDGDEISLDELPQNLRQSTAFTSRGVTPGKTLKEVREEVERDYIRFCLEQHNWNVTRAAQDLGIERSNLHKKVNYYRLQKGEHGGGGASAT